MNVHYRWLTLTLVSSALFLIVVDMTVLYTALPKLTLSLNANASEKLWIINAYPLVVAGLLPATGMLSDRIGHKNYLSMVFQFLPPPRCAPHSHRVLRCSSPHAYFWPWAQP